MQFYFSSQSKLQRAAPSLSSVTASSSSSHAPRSSTSSALPQFYPQASSATQQPHRFRTIRRLGRGSHGDVHLVEDAAGKTAVVKIETGISDSLSHEAGVYRALGRVYGFPAVYDYVGGSRTRRLYMQWLGQDLKSVRSHCGGRLSVRDALKVGIQLIDRLKHLHNAGYVHGVLHPGNVMFGRHGTPYTNTVFLIDFGDSLRYIRRNGIHMEQRKVQSIVGTLDFGSISMLQCHSQSRRDDMQSLLYLILYLINGYLPWSHLVHGGGRRRHSSQAPRTIQQIANDIVLRKANISAKDLAAGLPPQMISFTRDVRNLQYAQEPRYLLYTNFLSDSIKRIDGDPREEFDWQREKPIHVQHRARSANLPRRS